MHQSSITLSLSLFLCLSCTELNRDFSEIRSVLDGSEPGNTSRLCQPTATPTPSTNGLSVILANPGNLSSIVNNANPGDTILLTPGTYSTLYISNLHGAPGNPITIAGQGAQTVFVGAMGANTIEIRRSSWLVFQNFRMQDSQTNGFAVSLGGGVSQYSHDIVIDGLHISDYTGPVGGSHQYSAISTKAPVWNITIRNNLIEGVGLGMYLGNSDGEQPFIGGLIENNVIRNTLGYGMQIKHQFSRPTNIPGLPQETRETIIRNNVFANVGASASRPNLLLGSFPIDGTSGLNDRYLVYGNFFYQNPSAGEGLLQTNARAVIRGNLFVNTQGGRGIQIQSHHGGIRPSAGGSGTLAPQGTSVYSNTFVTTNRGVSISDNSNPHYIYGNAVFSNLPVSGGVPAQVSGNQADLYANADQYLSSPYGDPTLGTLDPTPISENSITGSPIGLASLFSGTLDWNYDYQGALLDDTTRGAFMNTTLCAPITLDGKL